MPWDPETGEFFHGTLADWRAAKDAVGGLLAYALRPDLFEAWTQQLLTSIAINAGETGVTVASGGGLIATGSGAAVVAGALPVVTMVGVFVALGAGYAEARQMAKNENFKSGFSQGFVMAVLDWTWIQAASRSVALRIWPRHHDLYRRSPSPNG